MHCKKNKSAQSFGASGAEIMAVFSDAKAPQKFKKALYELTDIPYFTEAVAHTPIEEVKKIAEKKINAKTNILDLALNGKITAGVGEDGFMRIIKFIDLPFIAKHNAASKNPKTQINLYQAMESMPVTVERLEYDAINMYDKANMFPPLVAYKAVACDFETLGKYPPHDPVNLHENLFRQTTGKMVIDDRDMLIKFEETVTSPYGARIDYHPTPRKLIDPPIEGITPNMRKVFNHSQIDKADKISLFDLTEIPYFTNLAAGTDALRLGAFAHINRESDDLFGKMFRKEIPIVVYNTSSEAPKRIPLVDIENLLLEKKRGIIQSDDLVEILQGNTFAMQVYKLRKDFMENVPGAVLQKMDFDSNGVMLETRFHTKDMFGDECVLAQRRSIDDPDARPIIGALEFFPKKMFSVELEETPPIM